MLRNISLVPLLVTLVAGAVHAQEEPPRPTPLITGSIGLDGTIDTFETQTRRAIVKAADGVRHVVHLSSRTVVHGASAAGEDTFAGLDAGSHVVVQYIDEGTEKTALEVDRIGTDGLKSVEGSVTQLDRKARTMAVRLADGSVVLLHLTERAAIDAGKDIRHGERVTVYYADEEGKQVAHYFKRVTTPRH